MVWTPAQTMVFLAAARRHRLHALWRLITSRGLRRGEGCGLRRPDTDLDAALTTIRWQITQLGWGPCSGRVLVRRRRAHGRPRHRHRHVCLAPEQDKEKEAAGDAWADSGFEFTDELGNPLHPAVVTGMFQMIAYLAGLPPIRLHDLRHGAATLLQRRGVASDASVRLRREDGATLIRPAGQVRAHRGSPRGKAAPESRPAGK